MAKYLELNKVNKTINGEDIVKDVSIEVENGQYVILTGPSGSGKSSVLRMSSGIDKPDNGEVLIDNINLADIHTKDKNKIIAQYVGLVLQYPGLDRGLDVWDNIVLPVESKGQKINKDKIDYLVDLFEIKDKIYSNSDKLSGGEQIRVSIVRALAVDTIKLFLADEPTNHLDTERKKIIFNYIATITKELNIAALIVTHDKAFAKEYADIEYTMVDGAVVSKNILNS